MMLVGNDRAAAVYKGIVAGNPAVSMLSGDVGGDGLPTATKIAPPGGGTPDYSEKYKLLLGLQQLWGADTTYLTSKAEIAPGTLAANSGIPVATTGGPAAQTGTTQAPGPLAAQGRGVLQ